MHHKEDLPFHHYSETYKYVNILDGHPMLSIDPKSPFLMTQFGIMSNRAQTETPHRHDYYEILFIEDGAGKHIIDYESYEINPPCFYFLLKGQIHFWKLEKALRGKVLLFPREFMIPPAEKKSNYEDDLVIINSLSRAPSVFIDDRNLVKMQELFLNLKEEFSRNQESSLSVLRAYTHILLVSLFRIHAMGQPSDILDTTNSMVRKYQQLVSENFLTIRTVHEYADLIGVSATHLRSTVKDITGYSPGQLIRQEIIFEAKRRLANTDATTAEIGYSLNFDDSSYFGRFFKRETGLSPAIYRQEIRKKYQLTFDQ